MNTSRSELRQELADHAHDRWCGWIKYMLSKGTYTPSGDFILPKEMIEQWRRQSVTPYFQLCPEEKSSDLSEAESYMGVLADLDFIPGGGDR